MPMSTDDNANVDENANFLAIFFPIFDWWIDVFIHNLLNDLLLIKVRISIFVKRLYENINLPAENLENG